METIKQIKHYEVIQALLSEPTIKDACKKLGVSRATLFNYTKKQEVKNLLRKVTSDAYNSLSNELAILHGKHLERIHNMALSDATPLRLKFDCSKFICSHALEVSKYTDIEQRITELEKVAHA
ncbi:MAG: hypothetical protein UHD07_05060 [Ruminobacter sp.]|nr:hypothetical protein [Ruminobacter sp.]